MNNNNDEKEEKKVENKNIVIINKKKPPEKKRHDIFAFVQLIDEKTKERLSRRIKKLSTVKRSIGNKSSFAINIEQIEQRIKNIINLEPFFSEFDDIMDKKGQNIITEIAVESSEDIFEKDKVIYKYGDEIDQFYLILNGEVDLFFPFTEQVYLNIDEFYVYILRLRRYNEIEMLNDVLLLNNGIFMKEIGSNFNIDEYIYKLYKTYIKIKYDPNFLILEENNKQGNNYELFINKNSKINLNDTFDDKEIKYLVLRISEELIETIKWIMPEKLCDIIEEKGDNRTFKKIIDVPENIKNKYKKLKPQNVNGHNYSERILPKKIENERLISKKMIIMKYLKIDSLEKGQHFGEFSSDTFALFSHSYLDMIKKSTFSQLIKLHKHNNFRNMSIVSSSYMHLYSFNKAIFSTNFSKFIEKKNLSKKAYLSKHPLFTKIKNYNLVNTYSICFKEKILKDGDIIIKENDLLKENDINTYFIIKGECQLSCYKTIPQIDELLKTFGKEYLIKNTYNKNIIDILNTPQYYELIKEPVKMKLNYLTKNDMVGITESFDKDKYFFNVQCTQKETKIYKVDSRIIKLFIDSDEKIKENKDQIIYDKYKLIWENLINQRKIFFDSLLNQNKISLEIDTGYKPNKIKYNCLPRINTYKALVLKRENNKNSKESLFGDYNIKYLNKKIKEKKIQTKLTHFNEGLDSLMRSITRGFTLRDRRIEKSKELRQKYKDKMMKLTIINELKNDKNKEFNKNIIEAEKEKSLDISNTYDKKFGAFRKTKSLYRDIYKILPALKTNALKDIDSRYELVLPYDYHKLKNSYSTSHINPLFYDDFNRSYNLSQYFNLKSDEKNKSEEKNKNCFEYTIKIRGNPDNKNKIFHKKLNLFTNRYKTRFTRINIRKSGIKL